MKLHISDIYNSLRSPRGKSVLTFLAFLVISTILWVVMSLNEDTQRDLSCRVVITNVPDSMVRVSPLPEAINVSVRAQGTQLIKYLWHKRPQMTIDYRQYKSGNKIQFSDAALKAFFRNMVGGGCQILSVTPDSLSVMYTSSPGIKLPVHTNVHVTPAPHFVVTGQVKSLIDSVTLYSVNSMDTVLKYLATVPLTLTDVRKSQIVRVPMRVPRGMRSIPDSVDVSIDVEPLISKTRKVTITPTHVPEGMSLVTVPMQVEVYYMVPMDVYKKSENEPKFKVEVDYRDIKDPTQEKVPVTLAYAPRELLNVFISVDSVDYILEHK